MYACLRDELAGKRVIYDAQNCEARLRQDLLGSTPFGRCLAESVRFIEGELCRRSRSAGATPSAHAVGNRIIFAIDDLGRICGAVARGSIEGLRSADDRHRKISCQDLDGGGMWPMREAYRSRAWITQRGLRFLVHSRV